MSSDVAHDLRTPLTRRHNRLDETRSARDVDEIRQAIEAAAAQSRELLDIFGALLRVAELEVLSPRAQFQDLQLDLLVDELVETHRPDMEASGHLLRTTIAPAIWTTGDRRLLQQLITNLLDNALRHPLERRFVSSWSVMTPLLA